MAAANIIGSRMLVVAAVTTMCLLVVGAPGVAGITCGEVASGIAPCISYIRNGGAISPSCCAGVRSICAAVNTSADRQALCACLQTIGRGITGLNPVLAAGVPGKCGANAGFPVSFSTDCSKVH